ncbi:hypothetical protein H0H92_010188, partial [Tricholoma furcatifolium]
AAAACAHRARWKKIRDNVPMVVDSYSESIKSVRDWTGGIDNIPSSDSEFFWTDSEGEETDSDEFTDLDGEELVACLNEELRKLAEMTSYEMVRGGKLTKKE